MWKGEKRNFEVTLGSYKFMVNATDENSAVTIALSIWSDNEDYYPEPVTKIEVNLVRASA